MLFLRIVTTMGIKDGRKLAAPALSAKLSVNMEENEAGAFKALFLACNDVSKKADVNWTAGCKIRTAHWHGKAWGKKGPNGNMFRKIVLDKDKQALSCIFRHRKLFPN